MRERWPHGKGWVQLPAPPAPLNVLGASYWSHGKTKVLSTLDMAQLPDGAGLGPQWHISVVRSKDGRASLPGKADLDRALSAFGMQKAEEDNHHPGNARHFFLPVDAAHRVDCECKADEDNVVTDGVRWTNPKPESGEACRGCEIEPLTGRPCPLHGDAAAAG